MKLSDHIRKLREDFMVGTLNENDVNNDPSLQFTEWLNQAMQAEVEEFQAMTLSTVSEDGRPSSRIVYLREFGDHNYSFYTNYNSRKGHNLEAQPFASLLFFWPSLQRQVRIEGQVSRCPEAQSDAYFNARPFDSKVGAWASEQSTHIDSRQVLEERVKHFNSLFNENNIHRPPNWGGYTLTATYYEFWQGRKSRLHDRIAYLSGPGNDWKITRLAP